jgi:hypothetical protein
MHPFSPQSLTYLTPQLTGGLSSASIKWNGAENLPAAVYLKESAHAAMPARYELVLLCKIAWKQSRVEGWTKDDAI